MITVNGSDDSPVVAAESPTKLPVMADTQGRRRLSKAQRREVLGAFARSGQSLPEFARRTGLKYSTLANWVKRSRPVKGPGPRPRLRLLEAVIEPAPAVAPASGLVLQLPGGVRVEVADEKQAALAAAIVRILAKPC